MRLFAFIIVAALAFNAPVWADDQFTVSNVKVDVTADNATSARDQGIVAAQRQALEKLFATLKPDAAAPKFSDDKISDLVRDFSVENEQSGGNRYVASYTIRFRPAATRSALNVAATPTAAPVSTAQKAEDTPFLSDASPALASAAGNLNAPTSAQNFIYIIVPAQSAKQLNDQRQNFMHVPGIVVTDIAQLNKDASTLRVSYNGSTDTILTNMVSRGIALKQRQGDVIDKTPVYELTSLSQNHL